MPMLAAVTALTVEPPPGWSLIRADLRKAYVAKLAAAGVRVTWSTK